MSDRMQELEQRFSALRDRLSDSPEKEAISVLHALLLEVSRRQQKAASGGIPGAGSGAAAPTPGGDNSLEKIQNLYKSAPGMDGKAENEGIQVGSRAPDFSLRDASGKLRSLSDYRGQNLVLAFYPLDWSPACSDQLSLYQSELDAFKQAGAAVVAISVDSIYSHGAWAAVRGITFPLLSDFHPKGDVARRYGVLRDSDGFSERALFLVDGEGIIRYKCVSPELPKIPSIYELFEQIDALDGQSGQRKGGGSD